MRLPGLRAFCYIIIGVLCTLLSSCIDGQEEITVREDGSGSAQISYNIPLRAMSKEDSALLEGYLKEVAGKHDSITLTNFSCKPSGFGMQRMDARVEFTSIQEVAKIYEEEVCGPKVPSKDPAIQSLLTKVCALMGKYTLSLDGLDISIKREVNLQPLFEGQVTNPKVFGESEFRYILHLPKAVDSTNATELSDDRKTLQWTIKLRDYYDKPIIMQSAISLPWWIYLCFALICVILLLLGVWIIRKVLGRKRRPEKNPPCPDSLG